MLLSPSQADVLKEEFNNTGLTWIVKEDNYERSFSSFNWHIHVLAFNGFIIQKGALIYYFP